MQQRGRDKHPRPEFGTKETAPPPKYSGASQFPRDSILAPNEAMPKRQHPRPTRKQEVAKETRGHDIWGTDLQELALSLKMKRFCPWGALEERAWGVSVFSGTKKSWLEASRV